MSALTIGLMSGTSMDGIDAALVRWHDDAPPETVAARTVPMAAELNQALRALGAEAPLAKVTDCDALLAEAFADAALALIDSADVSAAEVDAIGSHGQTVWHAPERVPPASIQIGDPHRIAERTGITVVADFRRRDIAAGGQGAPLAPLFHAALFAGTHGRAVVNIGGIANVSWLGPRGEGKVSGFDVGPGNTLMDAWYRSFHGGGAGFDRNGAWAASARPDAAMLEGLIRDPFFARRGPRSTGPEHFSLNWLRAHGCERLPPATVQATLLELTARTLSDALHRPPFPIEQILLCGGGAANTTLAARITELCRPVPVGNTEVLGVAPDYVEAVGFAWLARQALLGRRVSLPEVTGCRHPVPLGSVHPA